MQRLEVMAVLAPKIDDVAAFGSTKIPFVLFGAGRAEAERNAVAAQRRVIAQQVKLAFVFDNENGIGPHSGRTRRGGICSAKHEQQRCTGGEQMATIGGPDKNVAARIELPTSRIRNQS